MTHETHIIFWWTNERERKKREKIFATLFLVRLSYVSVVFQLSVQRARVAPYYHLSLQKKGKTPLIEHALRRHSVFVEGENSENAVRIEKSRQIIPGRNRIQ
jgi:hypothetical protein